MIMTEQQQKEYLESIHFCIKDFHKTNIKYKEYKDFEFKQFLRDCETEIKDFLNNFNEDIFNNLINDYKNYNKIQYFKFKEKKYIRFSKKIINDLTYSLISDFIINNINSNVINNNLVNVKLNNNTIRGFTTKFYLYFYDEINKEMKISLNDVVEHQTEDF